MNGPNARLAQSSEANGFDLSAIPRCFAARVRCALLVSAASMGPLAGCTPEKIVAFQPKAHVTWRHISDQDLESPNGDYRILIDQPSKGLFPADLAISRVAVYDPDHGTVMGEPRLIRNPRNEFLRWNNAFDDQMAISAVFPIAQRDLGGSQATPERVVAAMKALGARLGLVYGVNQISETETEMLGALYEIANNTPIASFHARAKTLARSEIREQDLDDDDPWQVDAAALARDRFERLVYECVRDLVLADEPADVVSPDGWIPAGPIRPVQWPPRDR